MGMSYDEYLSSDNGGASADEQDLAKVLAGLSDPNASIDDDDDGDVADDEPEIKPDPETKPDPEPEPKPAPKPEDKEASKPDQNSINAQRRREHEAKIAQKAIENSVEYKLIKEMADVAGITVEQLQRNIQAAKVAKELHAQGMPEDQIPAAAERIADERAKTQAALAEAERLQQQDTANQFQQWQTRIENETAQVKAEYPFLTEDDILASMDFMINVAKNPNLSVQQVVNAVHGQKIIDAKLEQLRTEELAKISGRIKGAAPAPQSNRAPDAGDDLTADEKFMAKMMKISEDEYKKWKPKR